MTELADHTSIKPESLLEAKASAAVADNAAFVFIDAIDPIGTLNAKVYERMGRVFDRLSPYYAELGGRRVADVAVYYSLDSKFDFAGNGRPVAAADATDAHTKSVTAVARALGSRHVPFGFITKTTLARLDDHRVLILPNVNMMDDAEIETIRAWARKGGCLLATGWTSLADTRGLLRKDFGLGDIFGVTLQSPSWTAWPHYIRPTAPGEADFAEFSPAYPAFARTTGLSIAARAGHDVSVLAATTLVWPTDDPKRFASIHSNPPWKATDRPEVVLNRFGAGRSIYCASPIETVESLGECLVRLVRRLSGPFRFEADAPAAVEVTMFHQPEKHRYRLSLVNFQKELPNIPITQIPVRLRLPERVIRVVQIPGDGKIDHTDTGGVVQFTVPRLESLAMFGVIVA
jgi:hypothetical protein